MADGEQFELEAHEPMVRPVDELGLAYGQIAARRRGLELSEPAYWSIVDDVRFAVRGVLGEAGIESQSLSSDHEAEWQRYGDRIAQRPHALGRWGGEIATQQMLDS